MSPHEVIGLMELNAVLLAALKFVATDPCFPLLGSVTHDEVRAAIAKAEGR